LVVSAFASVVIASVFRQNKNTPAQGICVLKSIFSVFAFFSSGYGMKIGIYICEG
jgi:hypothetical protein